MLLAITFIIDENLPIMTEYKSPTSNRHMPSKRILKPIQALCI